MDSNLILNKLCDQSLQLNITDKACEILQLAYLPTISLIVFVKTPFRARARDTAGDTHKQTHYWTSVYCCSR